jgi:uncharacterized membrane protein
MFNTDHLHPMIVHFPIALITVGFFAEVISLFFQKRKVSFKNRILSYGVGIPWGNSCMVNRSLIY